MLLKALTVCLLVTQCVGAPKSSPPAVGGPIDELIVALLEAFRDSLSEPQPIPDIPFNLDVPGLLTIHLNITEALLHDLSTFVIDNIHVNMLTLKLDLALSLPTLSLECNYAFGSGSVIGDLFPLYGAGPASFAMEGMVLTANADLKQNFSGGHDHYQITDLDFYYHFDTLDVQMHNLFNSEDMATVIDGFADDLGPILVDVIVNETRTDLMPVIIDVLNDILWNATILSPSPEAADEAPLSEPLKPVPVKLPIRDGVEARQAPLQNLPKIDRVGQADVPKINIKRRQGKYP
ncbi:uncharacterized protein LOC122366857 [Amphibalanus amphitrite]|uniref:uncharacterized protein LOC122366857 n=1 Tax=Amphibalanus amphitrite TaxID=1232801 RepID=UPI001C91ADD0|nr:uncharacterized protein LOC122366857 [Amphibalanus amphitrite]